MLYLSGVKGLPGLFVAGMFSGALSTVSSAVNSFAAVLLEDFVRPFCISQNTYDKHAALILKVSAFFFGILCVLITGVVEHLGGILQAASIIFGMAGGPLLGVFTLGILCRKANQEAALSGLIAGLVMGFWVGIGAMAYGLKPHLLPLLDDGCQASSAAASALTTPAVSYISNNVTVTVPAVLSQSTLADNVTTTTDVIIGETYVLPLYRLSYRWYCGFGWLVTVVVGFMVTLLTGGAKDVDPRCLSSLVRKGPIDGPRKSWSLERTRNLLATSSQLHVRGHSPGRAVRELLLWHAVVVINISYIFATPIAAYLFLPVFYNLEIVSVYEVLYMAVVLYAPAVALSAVTGISKWISILSVGLVCTFYCTIGGMKAVLWTDLFQSILMFAAMFAVVAVGTYRMGGVYNVWSEAQAGGRIEFWNFDPDPTVRHSVWSLAVGVIFVYVSLYGVNQAQVQRLMTVSTLKKAQGALFLNWPILSALSLTASFAGIVMYANFRHCEPLLSGKITSTDQVLPYFVMVFLGGVQGLPGLVVAGIFSGALSTVSSAVNSLAAVLLEDFLRPFCIPQKTYDKHASLILKVLAFSFGILCVLLTAVVEQLGGVLQASFMIFGVVGGPLLGVFTLGLFCRKANQPSLGSEHQGWTLEALVPGKVVEPIAHKSQKKESWTDTVRATGGKTENPETSTGNKKQQNNSKEEERIDVLRKENEDMRKKNAELRAMIQQLTQSTNIISREWTGRQPPTDQPSPNKVMTKSKTGERGASGKEKAY
ncbi:hypothetical protein HPB48_002511 [Haemaphysalis longicornis]|uniref:Sodium-dependent multivitamin transporter n=1 Tax=Haemaphysalis longicornis TaxID=44386 RepID=A0A9J6FWS0_HAELO|nr:hypothetical protein HPB48_002511 [Haemaphysalis longicornis]